MSDPVTQDQAAKYQGYRAEVVRAQAGENLLREVGGATEASPKGPAVAEGGLTSLITGQKAPQHSMAYRASADIARGVTEIPRAALKGVRDAVSNTLGMGDDFYDWVKKKVTDTPLDFMTRQIVHDKDGFRLNTAEEAKNTPEIKLGQQLPDIGAPTSVTGGLVKNTAQFLAGLAMTKGVMGRAGLPDQLEGAAGYAYSSLKGALANFAAFDPHQKRLSDLIEQFPVLSNPVTGYLKSDPEDSAADGRLKNSLEGVGLGAATDGLIKGLKFLRSVINTKNAGEALPPEALAQAEVEENPKMTFGMLGDTSEEAPLISKTPLGNQLKAMHAQDMTRSVEPSEVADTTPAPAKTYINFAKINTPEDIQTVTQKIADKFSRSVQNAQRGKQTFEEIKLDADMENAWKVLQNRRVGEPLNASQSVAARQLWASSAEKLKELAETAVASPNEENLFAFRKMMATHYAIQNEVLGARTETARALASWRIPVGSSAARLSDITDQMREVGGGADTIREMAMRVAGLARAEMPYQLDQFINKSAYARSRDAVIQAFSDGLLSSPVTQTKILASNVSTGLWRIAERKVAEKISSALETPDGVAPGEAAAMWSGWTGGFKDAMAYAWKAAKTGVTGEGIGEPKESYPSNLSSEALQLGDKPWLGRAADFIGGALSIGRRGIAAQHDAALTMAYRGELNAQAVRQALSEVNAGELAQEGFEGRVADLLNNPPSALAESAKQGAKYQAFLDEPGKITQWILDGRRQIPALRVIAPFIKIPSRIMSYTFERTPLAPLMSEFRAKIAAGGAARDLALAQVGMGTMISLAAADMSMRGTIKGGGPPQKGLEQAEEREGAMRDSLQVGNKWFNINGVHPIGKLMLLATDVTEAIRGGQTELHQDVDTEHLAAGTVLAIARTLTDSSYFQGFANLFATLHDSRVGGAGEGALLSTAGSTVPAAVGAADRALDPYQRAVYNMLDEFKSKIPGLSQTLPPRRDLWGSPVPSGHDPITSLISPVKIADAKHEPIDDEILKQGMNITMPDRNVTFNGSMGGNASVDMSKYPAAFSRYLELSGNALKHPGWGMGAKDLLNAVVTGNHPLSAVYRLKSDGPEGGKEVMVRDIISQYRDLAKRQLLQEYSDLRADVDEKAAAQRALKLGAM